MRFAAFALVIVLAAPVAAQCECVCPMAEPAPPPEVSPWPVLMGAVALIAGVILSVVSLAVVAQTSEHVVIVEVPP